MYTLSLGYSDEKSQNTKCTGHFPFVFKNIYFDYFNEKVSLQNAEVLSYNIDVWDKMQQYTIKYCGTL